MAVRPARAVALSRAQPNAFARELFDGLPAPLRRRWRRCSPSGRTIAGAPRWSTRSSSRAPPRRVLDVATGTAGVALMLTERTGAEVVGIDLTEQMLREGRERVGEAGRGDRIDLVCGRGEQLPFPDATFDALTFTYLLRYVADPAATVRELARVVRPGRDASPPGVLRPPAAGLALRLVALHPRWSCPRRAARRRARLGERRPLPRPVHRGHYRHYPVDGHVDAVARRRPGRRAGARR